jgi:phosphoribosylglycinamide formyltransferase
MVHRVVKDVDAGEPVVVREVPIEKGEPLEEFEQRLHKVEHQIIVEAAAKVLNEAKPAQVCQTNTSCLHSSPACQTA